MTAEVIRRHRIRAQRLAGAPTAARLCASRHRLATAATRSRSLGKASKQASA